MHAKGVVTEDAEELDPQSLAEVKWHSDWNLQKKAMEKEMDTLKKAETWIVVKRSPGSKWAFCLKKNSGGQIEKHNA